MRNLSMLIIGVLFCYTVSAQPAIIWQTSLLDTLDEAFYNIGKSPVDGGFFAVGSIAPKVADECGKIYTQGKAWVCKFDVNNDLLWSNCYGGSDGDAALGVVGLNDGGCLVLGQTYSNDGDVSGNHGNIDFWLFRLNSGGELIWQRCYGGSSDDEPKSLIPTIDGGYLMLGFTQSIDGDLANHIGNQFYVDAWVIKLDSNFDIEWENVYGGSLEDYAYYALQLADSCYIITGQSTSSDYDIPSNHGDSDGFILKLDPSGNVIWSKSYGGSARDVLSQIHKTADGGFAISGTTASNVIQTPDFFLQGNIGFTGNDDVWVLRLDSLGNFMNATTFGGSNTDLGRPSVLLSDGSLVIGASTRSNDFDVVSNYADNNIWYLRINEQDSIIDSKVIGGNQFDVCWNMMLTDAGTILIPAYTGSVDGDVVFHHSGIYDPYTWDGWIFEIADPTFIDDISLIHSRMYIFPNPILNTATVTISNKKKGEKNTLTLCNLQGIALWSKDIYYDNAVIIDSKNLPSGIYILSLCDSYGEIITANKLIIQ